MLWISSQLNYGSNPSQSAEIQLCTEAVRIHHTRWLAVQARLYFFLSLTGGVQGWELAIFFSFLTVPFAFTHHGVCRYGFLFESNSNFYMYIKGGVWLSVVFSSLFKPWSACYFFVTLSFHRVLKCLTYSEQYSFLLEKSAVNFKNKKVQSILVHFKNIQCIQREFGLLPWSVNKLLLLPLSWI